ncbi:MAG: hypothetical protein M1457_09685, partial [bacterium]|nr:hypothetical protein [bacterium]
PRINRIRRAAVIGCGALWLGLSLSAPAQVVKPLSFEELVAKSDQIYTATCVSRKAEFRNGHIVTTYKLQPVDVWKGDPKRDKSGEVEFEEQGGALEGAVPLATYVPGMADIGKSEEVLLFTQNPQPPAREIQGVEHKAALRADTPRITGFSQGRFSIIRNPVTGEKLVTRVRQGIMPDQPENVSLRQALARANAPDRATTAPQDRARARAARQDYQRKVARHLADVKEQNLLAHEARVAKDPKAKNEFVEFSNLEAVRDQVARLLRKQ